MEVLNKKTLAIKCGLTYKTLEAQLKAMLSDRQVRKTFGKYTGKCFTPKQLQIIREELGYEI